DWQIVALARASLAFVFSAGLALSTGARLVLLRPAVLWMRSIAGSFGVLFAFYALTHLPVSTSLTLSNTVPLWVTLLAWPVLGQRPRASVWAAIGIGLAGIVLIQRPEAVGNHLAAAMALALGSPSRVSVVGLMQIVFALLFDLLFWKRQFGPPVVLGIALVVGPSAWLMLRSPLRRQSDAIHTTG